MCQGHEQSAPEVAAAFSTVSEPSAPGQPTRTEQTRRQKAKFNKAQQKQQNSIPKEYNPLPTHEIIKEKAVELANGIRYVDVPCVRYVANVDALSHVHDDRALSKSL